MHLAKADAAWQKQILNSYLPGSIFWIDSLIGRVDFWYTIVLRDRKFRRMNPRVHCTRLGLYQPSISQSGTLVGRTRSADFGGTTTRTPRVSSSLLIATIEIALRMLARRSQRSWVRMRCAMLFFLCSPTSRTCPMRCLLLK